jgi:hypothetical protein
VICWKWSLRESHYHSEDAVLNETACNFPRRLRSICDVATHLVRYSIVYY